MKVVPIPEKMQKYYGTGTMLHPNKEMVMQLMQEIPFGQVATIDAFCEKMARDQGTNAACPMRTGNFVKTLTATYSETDEIVPFWRVIRKNHYLINSPFLELCAERLQEEGLKIEKNSKGEFKVIELEKHEYTFN